MKKLFFVFIVYVLFAGQALAANQYLYVRDGATGTTCADWGANACGSVSTAEALVNRAANDAVYIYIADGTYGGVTFNASASGSKYVYVKRATVADHGPESATWSDDYVGDGQATFTGTLRFESNYWKLDGNTSSPPTGVGSYGFKIDSTTAQYYIFNYGGASYITIKDVDIDCRSNTACIAGTELKCIQGSGALSNITITNIRCINFGDGISTQGNDLVVEYSELRRASTGTEYEMTWNGHGSCGDCEAIANIYPDDGFCADADHGDALGFAASTGTVGGPYTIKYNIFEWNGQNIWFYGTGSATFDNIYIYGNLFYLTTAETAGGSCAAVKPNSACTITDLYFYNNTVSRYVYAVQDNSANSSGSAKNNILVNLTNYSFGDLSHSYNAATGTISGDTGFESITTGIFTNYSAYNFTLKQATTAGDSTIGESYNKDMLGSTRGLDGTWDRGAYEYGTGTTPPSTTGCTISGASFK